MVQIVNETSAGGRLGEALGTGIGQGLAALAEHKLKSLTKTRKTEEFKSGLKTAYGDQIPESQLDILAKAMAEDPKVAQKFWESQFKQQEEEAFQKREQKARQERAKTKAAGLPGSENFNEEEIEAPEIAGRLPRNEREREQFAKMNQKERLAYQARQDKQYEQILAKNAPGIKSRAEKFSSAEQLGKLSKEAIDIIKSEKAASGALGGILPLRFSSDATNRLESIKSKIVGLEASLQGGGKQSQKLLELIEKQKSQPYQSTKVQLQNMEDIYNEYKLAKDEIKAEQQILAENNGRQPHNLDERVRERVKQIEKERTKASYQLNKKFPAKDLTINQTATDQETGQKMIVALVGGKKKWIPLEEFEQAQKDNAITQQQGV